MAAFDGNSSEPLYRWVDEEDDDKPEETTSKKEFSGDIGKRIKEQKTRSQKKLLKAVTNVRDDPEMCDVTFLVGREEGKKRHIEANSAILAVRSEYFKVMCYGPMKSENEKIIPDMSPDTFDRVLDFIHAKDFDLVNLFLDELWELRYAAAQFLLPDLEEICEDILSTRLTRSNALLFLKKASMYKCDSFRRRALRVLKNRYLQTLKSNEICGLEEADFLELIKLYSGVRTDHIIDAAFLWSKNKTEEEFKEAFWNRFFHHIRWDHLSNEQMLEIHRIKLLPLELEHEAMLKIISRSDPLPKDELETVCEIELEIPHDYPIRSSGTSRVLEALLMRTMIAFKPGCIKADQPKLWLDREGLNLVNRTLEARSLTAMPLDCEDITVEFDVNRSGIRTAKVFSFECFHLKVDNRDVFFFTIKFDPIKLSDLSDKAEGSDNVYYKVSFQPGLLMDMQDFMVQPTGRTVKKIRQLIDGPSDTRSPSTRQPAKVKSWRSVSGIPCPMGGTREDRDAIGSSEEQPKYFFDGCGLPVFVALG